MLTKDQISLICSEARSWLGTPYFPHAHVKGVGVDCGWLLREVYGVVFGPFPLLPADYSADWALHSNRERYLEFIQPFVQPCHAPRPGGFSVYHVGQAYSHAAIFTDAGDYIHSWGRLRAGGVMRSPVRMMNYLGKQSGFPIKHFEPK